MTERHLAAKNLCHLAQKFAPRKDERRRPKEPAKLAKPGLPKNGRNMEKEAYNIEYRKQQLPLVQAPYVVGVGIVSFVTAGVK